MRPPIAMLAMLALASASCSRESDSAGTSANKPRTEGARFEASRDTDRGFERVREVIRHDTVSELRVETNFYGGALGSAYFGQDCVDRLCEERGFTHWVILAHEVSRTGDQQAPGNDWAVHVGFMRSPAEPSAISTLFPQHAREHRDYQVHALPSGPTETEPESMPKSKDLWDVFSSLHFRFTK